MTLMWLWASMTAAPLTARPVQVTAQKLEVFAKENRAVYSGNATAVRDSTTIRCEKLFVYYTDGQNVSRIEAVGRVHAQDGSREAKGERADFDNSTGVLVLTGQPEAYDGPTRVSGSQVKWTVGKNLIEVEDAKTLMEQAPVPGKRQKVLIQSPRLAIEGKKQRAVWTGRVRATRQDAVILADKLIAHYDDEHQLTRLEAVRNVEVTEKDRWAASDMADFDNRTGILVMTGNPRARQKGNTLRGSRIVFTVGTDLLEVENAESVIESAPGLERKKP